MVLFDELIDLVLGLAEAGLDLLVQLGLFHDLVILVPGLGDAGFYLLIQIILFDKIADLVLGLVESGFDFFVNIRLAEKLIEKTLQTHGTISFPRLVVMLFILDMICRSYAKEFTF